LQGNALLHVRSDVLFLHITVVEAEIVQEII